MPKANHYTVVVIGTGFGGTMTALPVAREFTQRKKGETVLMLERGTWWTTPVGTVQDKEVKTYDFLLQKDQPVQYWSTPNHFSGFLDIFTRCFRHRKNEDGLYDLSFLGRSGWLGLFGRQNDGVSVIRACGVGGGSLVYSNITIRPPNFIFDNWPLTWTDAERNAWFDLARNGISRGILWALEQPGQSLIPPPPGVLQAGSVNTGLSNILTRTAGLDPHWVIQPDPNNSRGLKQIQPPPNPVPPGRLDANNDLWIDRARLFQTAISKLTPEFGAVDLAINDFDPANPGNQYDAAGNAKNYCERQGRCNVGCLPGARHTLNKQLMAALFGSPSNPTPIFKNGELEIAPLAEVDVIVARAAGGYEIRYAQRDRDKPWRTTSGSVTADKVVVAAGCLGTNEIMLRSKTTAGALPNLSDKTGYGFSTNGDYIAFLDGTKSRMRLTRGPVTTSFGHFNTGNPKTGMDVTKFHNIEDQGIPPALATIVGSGVPFIRKLSGAYHHLFFIVYAAVKWALKKLIHAIRALFQNFAVRQDMFESDDEILAKMLCVTAQGRDAANGEFRLGTNERDTPLRLKRADGEFWQDPIYKEIEKTLDQLAPVVAENPGSRFQNPFLNQLTRELEAESISVAHPLGGCRIAKDVSAGVVDEYGRVFDKTKSGSNPFYDGLYIADASVIPTALGVNPSLTIATLSLRIAKKIIEEL